MPHKISRQLFINYLIICIMVVVFIGSVYFINKSYNDYHMENTSVDLTKLEDDYYTHGFDKAIEMQNFAIDDSVLLLNSDNIVLESYNFSFRKGYTLTNDEFTNLIGGDESYNNYFYKSYDNTLFIIVGLNSYVNYIDIVQLLIVAFGILFVVLVLIYSQYTARKIVKPIEKLAEGVTTIAGGKYGSTIHFESNNELNTLKDAINTMSNTLRENQEERIHNEKAKQQFIINISHDIRTPLTNIIGYSDQLLSMGDENITWRPSVEIINHYGNQASDLVNNLFELSRMELETFHFELHKTDVIELLRRVFIEYIQEFEDKSIDYDIKLPDRKVFANINQLQFERVLHNLIGNSIKYNQSPLAIKLSAHVQEEALVIQLEDNGIGIPLPYHASIFKPLVRVETSRNRKTGGSGLGLSIAKEIMEHHHGTITLENNKKQGCSFLLTLPIILE